jgi:hypothetical protein
MPARSDDYPWPSHYGDFDFFEARMNSHHSVESLKYHNDGLYDLIRYSGKAIRIFICECYSFGVAEYMEVVENLGTVDAIIINSSWCGYPLEAKRHCRDQEVGLFRIGDFMAALNRDKFWSYLSEDEAEKFKDKGWL